MEVKEEEEGAEDVRVLNTPKKVASANSITGQWKHTSAAVGT